MRNATDGRRPRRILEPYVGARAFQSEDADVFFGRDDEASAALSLWLSERVTVLHGPSAAGKTSFVQAGMVPALRASGADVDLLPVARLQPRSADLLNGDFTRYLVAHWAADDRSDGPSVSVTEFLRYHHAKAGRATPLLVVIDQLEAVFIPSSGVIEGPERLLGELARAVNAITDVHLLLVIHNDYLDQLTSYSCLFADHVLRQFPLALLDRAATVAAITKPAVMAGRRYEDAAVRLLSEDLRSGLDDRTDPVQLQIACRSLWAMVPSTVNLITADQVRSWGGLEVALGDFYSGVVREVSESAGIAEDRLREWLQTAFVTEVGTRDTVHRGRTSTAGMTNEVGDVLVTRYLLTQEYRDHAIWYRLSHERLAAVVLQANRSWWRGRAHSAADALETGAATQEAAEAALRAGDLVTAERKIAEATAAYEAAGDLRRFAGSRVVHGEIARARRDYTAAERYYREALSAFLVLEDQFSAARMLVAIADLRYKAGDFMEAADLNRQAVDRMPGDVVALTGLAYAQWRDGSPADAEATFDQALRWDSETALALAGRGQVRADLGRYERALDDLDRALRFSLTRETETDVRSARALALAGLGREAEALDELSASLRHDPERARSRSRADRIAAILREHKEAS